jgi:hypothetical protein
MTPARPWHLPGRALDCPECGAQLATVPPRSVARVLGPRRCWAALGHAEVFECGVCLTAAVVDVVAVRPRTTARGRGSA